MSLLQLSNLQSELTGLVESRFNNTVNLSSTQNVTGAKTFTSGFRGTNTTITASQTLTSNVFGGRVFIRAGTLVITLTTPPPTAGAMFLLQFNVASTADLTIQTGSTNIKFRGSPGSGTNSQTIKRSYGASWIFHSDGTDWFLSCIPNVNSAGEVVANIKAPISSQTGAGVGIADDGDIEQTVPYITSEDLEAYILLRSFLTTTTASTTYLTKSQADTDFLRIEDLPEYVTPATLAAYMTSGEISSTYQTMTGMTDYLTTAAASSTYQTTTGMESYLTKAGANTDYLRKDDALMTYQPIGAMSAYAPINDPTFTGTINGITKSMVGLGNVDNTTD